MIDRARIKAMASYLEIERGFVAHLPRVELKQIVFDYLALLTIVEALAADGLIGHSGNSDGFPWYQCRYCRGDSSTYLEDLEHEEGCLVARAIELLFTEPAP